MGTGTSSCSYCPRMIGLESRKVTVARLQAIGQSCTTAMRSSAFASTWCACGSSGSQKKKTVHAPLGDPRGNQQVGVERPAEKSGDGVSELILDKPSGCSRRVEFVPGHGIAVEARPVEHVEHAVVVRN
jgi:hypothetical protein